MKEIKAYVRVSRIQDVVDALIREGFCCMTIIDVAGLGNFIDPEHTQYSMEYIARTAKMAKIELVCAESSADKVVGIIRHHAMTEHPGDGIIFVSPVDRAVKIRSGAEGPSVLQT